MGIEPKASYAPTEVRSRGMVAMRAPLIIALIVGLLVPTSPVAARPLPGAPDCPILPASNVWNKRVDTLPVRADSRTLIKSIGLGASLHPDFSSIAGGNYGIPFNVVGAGATKYKVKFTYADESDAGPYPIPARPKIEGGSDRHLLVVDRSSCKLYELFDARRTASGGWKAGAGAIWKLTSNHLRPKGWTSADAAGLPILPGLVRYDEVAAGAIRHALRFTAPITRRAYIYPARHYASSNTSKSLPPMGLRVRLKASVDIRGFGPQARVVLRALKLYGMILADNGSPWYVTGAPNAGWDDDDLHELQQITGADFEVVDTSNLRNGS
jgi:opacity protein-like surface antigen